MAVKKALILLATLAGPAVAQSNGAALFAQNCAMCHQNGAVGLAGQFPRLAGRVGPISSKPAGRAYLIDVLSYGMAGQVTIDHQPIIGVMPPFTQLPADQVAAVLNYVQGLGKPSKQLFEAAEIEAGRAKAAKTPSQVLAERQSLVTAKVIE